MKITISEKLSDYFVKNNIIKAEEKEIYQYGFEQGSFMLLNLATTILVGLVFGLIFESLLYLIFYIPLRNYAGGFHAKTRTRCYIFGTLLIISALCILKFIPYNIIVCLISLVFSIATVLILSPVEDRNKPLDQIEKVVYRKRSYIILFVLILFVALSWFLKWQNITYCISVALFQLSIMLILGKIKNRNLH